MHFGLTNAPGGFQRFLNDIFLMFMLLSVTIFPLFTLDTRQIYLCIPSPYYSFHYTQVFTLPSILLDTCFTYALLFSLIHVLLINTASVAYLYKQ